MCKHTPGQAKPLAVSQRVKVSNQPIVTQPVQYGVTGCGLTGTPNPPCATAVWTRGAKKVTSEGMPVLLEDSISICTPTLTPLDVKATQERVKGI